MNYGRIRRGPMAADAFTQIRNALFRDNRLSFRDKGIFGLISTHRDGFGVSAESIAACSTTDGITAVKASLRSLETYGYLQRTRQRNKNGTLGSAVYFITDMPEHLEADPELENRRSEPAVAQPPVAEPTLAQPMVAEPAVAQPTVAELPHKNTKSKKTSSKNTTTSSRVPKPRPAEPAATTEGEAKATIRTAEAIQFLQQLPGLWSLGARTAASLAPLLLDTIEAQGWALDDELVTKLTEDRGYVDRPAGALKFRIEDLPRKPLLVAAVPKLRVAHSLCVCCGSQTPAALTVHGRGYCTNCTSTCTSCAQAVPTDHLQDGQCLTCLPIEARTAA